MKKIITAALALILAISMTACGLVSANEKTFESNGLKITLNDSFKENESAAYDVVFESAYSAFFALKESFEMLDALEDYTLEEYAGLVALANESKTEEGFKEQDGLLCLEYTYHDEEANADYAYLTTVFKGPDAFWTVQFACEADKFEDLKPDFMKWFKTIEFSEK